MHFFSSIAAPASLYVLTLALAVFVTSAPAATATREGMLQWLDEYRFASEGPAPGAAIGVEGIDELEPFLAPGFIDEFRFSDVTVEIEEPYHYEVPAIYQEATAQGGDRATLGVDGALENYVAGLPFSRARIDAASPADAGLMVAWDHIHRWQHYGYHLDEMKLSLVRPSAAGQHGSLPEGLEGGGSVDRYMAMFYHRVYLSHIAMLPEHGHRVDIDGAEQLLWKEYIEILEPFDVKGTKFVVERAFANEDDQVNSYLPSQRRVRRMSAKERADSFMGTDFTFDDFEVFSGRVFDYKWTYLGQKSILSVANSKHETAKFFGPSSRVPKDRWQVRPCYVVELTAMWEGHPYASRIMFIDIETLNTTFASIFDHDGNLWKSLYTVLQSPRDMNGAAAAVEHSVVHWRASIAIDHENDRATMAIGQKVSYPTMTASRIRRTFDVSNLTSGR